jgi:hypothetical protein
MPQITATLATPWGLGAALWAAPVVTPWGLLSAVWSTGGPYTAPSPPGGGTPTAPSASPLLSLPAAAAYNLVHALDVRDLRDDTVLPVERVTISTDRDSIFWTLRASGGAALFTKLSTGAQPPRLRVTVDGAVWEFVIESVTRSRQFPSTEVAIEGRSQTCVAGAPYQGEQTWAVEGDTTAAQIAASANLYTGLEVLWELDDWPVPAGVFSYSGTPLGVVRRVAEAAGAVLQSQRAGYGMTVRPRYPLMPNEWGTAAPELELPMAVVESESFQLDDQPPYDGVVVAGQQQGAIGLVRLAGTTGAHQAPMVSDVLITDLIAARQRGQAILGRSGQQQIHSITLPVLKVGGVAVVPEPGWLVKVLDTPAWPGLVTAVQLEVQLPNATLGLTLERHTQLVDGTAAAPPITDVLTFTGPIPDIEVAPGGAVDVDLSGYFTGGEPPVVYSLRSGTLPAWLTLDDETGHLVGTAPGTPETTALAVRASDAIDSTADSDEFSVVVASVASGPAIFLLSADNALPHYRSNDNGATWATVPGLGASRLSRMVKAGSRYVAAGGTMLRGGPGGNPPHGSFVWNSTDLVNWTAVSDATVNQSSGASVYPGYSGLAGKPDGRALIANFTPSNPAGAYFSDDGTTWGSSIATKLYGAHWSQALGLWLVTGFNLALTSPTAASGSWTSRSIGTGTWHHIAEGGGRLVVAHGAAATVPAPVATSTNGTSWTRDAAGLPADSLGLAYGAGRFVSGLADTAAVAHSTDGLTWTVGTGISGASSGWSPIWTGSEFLLIVVRTAAPTAHHLYASGDGISWSFRAALPAGASYLHVRAPDA